MSRPAGAPPLCKVCEVEDFRRPDIRTWIRDVFGVIAAREGAAFPDGREYRKHWEVAMAMAAFREAGVLHRDAEVLGVGAGNEPTVYALTRHVRRVFATDLYLSAGEWDESASAGMLTDPGRFWRGPFEPRRLVVQHMDGRDLRYEDASFDGVFSSSSIEHFGDHDDVGRALDEMFRVLRPGGVVSLSTEIRLAGPPPGLPDVLMFDRAELEELLAGRDWELLGGPLRTEISAATLASAHPFEDAADDVRAHVAEFGAIHWDDLRWSHHPQVVLDEGDLRWTSVHVALRRRRRRFTLR